MCVCCIPDATSELFEVQWILAYARAVLGTNIRSCVFIVFAPRLSERGPVDVVRSVFRGASLGAANTLAKCDSEFDLAEILRPNKPDFGAVGAFPVKVNQVLRVRSVALLSPCFCLLTGGRLPAQNSVTGALLPAISR